ncbi:MAG: glycosyltransferase family 2 protein [Erysipelotrichaceae bacterium]|nr:glycosyltransferase family 2 protein [Erysipelotrichaceae bacterium]
MKRLSILIPHYNSPSLLFILLQSIPNDPEVEVLVCDDLSTKDVDQYETLKKQFTHVHFYSNTTGHKGAGAARNHLIDHAIGEYILFADADDFFENDFLSKVRPYFNQEYDLVFFKSKCVYLNTDIDGHRTDTYNTLVDHFLHQKDQVSEDRCRFEIPSVLVKLTRRSVIMDHGLKFDLIYGSEDVMFAIKVGYYANKVIADENSIYVVTRNHGSLSTINSRTTYDTQFEILFQRSSFLKANLSKERFSSIRFPSLSFILTAIKRHYPLKDILLNIKRMRENGLRLLPRGFYRPSVITKNISTRIKERKSKKQLERKL